MMPNDVISFHTVQCLWQIGVTWDSNKVLFFYISELIILIIVLFLLKQVLFIKTQLNIVKIAALSFKDSTLSQNAQ